MNDDDMTDPVKNHMRELMEQFWAEQPATKPTTGLDTVTILGDAAIAAHNEAQFMLEEAKLREATKMAKVFRDRHGRLPRSMCELLADPVCKKMEEARIEAWTRRMLQQSKR